MRKIDKYDAFPYTAYVHVGAERGHMTQEEFFSVTERIDKEYARLLLLGQEPALLTDGNGYEVEKDGRPGRGFITCLDKVSYDWISETAREVVLEGG